MREIAKFRAIFDKYRPPGIKVRWKRSGKLAPAEARLENASMLVPRLTSLEALGYALHECGHFWQKHFRPEEAPTKYHRTLYTGNIARTVAQQEHEAEHWAIAVMRLEGLQVSHILLGDMKTYVAECLDYDTLGCRSPRRVRAWIK